VCLRPLQISLRKRFETVSQTYLKKNPNLLHLLVTQIHPKLLRDAGIPVYTTLQHEGQFIVTCPRSFHGGFNTGFNCAESVNFALEDWLPFCEKACQDYRYQRSSVFPYEEFVLKAGQNPDSPLIQKMLFTELKKILASERECRKIVEEMGFLPVVVPTVKPTRSRGGKDKGCGYQSCAECGFDCYLSSLVCTNHPDRVVCLLHRDRMCGCDPSQKRLQIRKNIEEFEVIANKLESSNPFGS